MNADNAFLPQPYKVSAIPKEAEASRGEETYKGQCGLAIESLSTRREALDLSPMPQKTEEKGEREQKRGEGEKGREGRGEKRKLPALAKPKLMISTLARTPPDRW